MLQIDSVHGVEALPEAEVVRLCRATSSWTERLELEIAELSRRAHTNPTDGWHVN